MQTLHAMYHQYHSLTFMTFKTATNTEPMNLFSSQATLEKLLTHTTDIGYST